MNVNLITEMTIVGVFDRGVANQERIMIRVNETVNMGQYGLLLGLRSEGAAAIPINDCFYWFGEGLVHSGEFIFVYTGPGEPVDSILPDNKTKTYSLHWGRDTTVLQNIEVVPILFQTDAVFVFQNQPQLPAQS